MRLLVLILAAALLAGCSDPKPEEVAPPPPSRMSPSAPPRVQAKRETAPANSGRVDQAARWREATVNPAHSVALDKLVARYQRTMAAYQSVTAMKQHGVPAPLVFCMFYRESDNNFADSPAQGDPLTHRSRNVPAGRIPGKNPPFAWADAAFDAYYVCDHMDRKDWSTVPSTLSALTSFNGTGYDDHHPDVPTPYLWSGTSIYKRGKYVSDGRFDKLAVDQQMGCAAILKRMKERNISLPFD